MIEQHLVIIFDTREESTDVKISPKKYDCLTSKKTKDEAIRAAKKSYESAYHNFTYESFYFLHQIK